MGDLHTPEPATTRFTAKIASYWKIKGKTFALDVTIPPNTTATVYVPSEDVKSVKEGSKPAAKAEGVTFLAVDEGKSIFALGSGRYRFASKLPD